MGLDDALNRWFVTGGGLLAGEAERRDLIGERLGAFRIAEEIGHGGMATVYRAERIDGGFEQQVAIKIFDLDPDHPVAARFRDERDLLARLDHPGIARIYDGGELGTGAPYLILELVRGTSLDRHCEALSLEDGLACFIEICDAVSAAHAEGIVHHDLKPANVLVDRHGHPKLLDFGIASAGGVCETDGAPLFTPRYGAPEQFDGDSAGPQTDVFQLGLLLYEVVTGTKATAGSSLAQLKRQASALPRLAASESAGPHQRLLDRRFDTIVARCLEAEPGRRYSSVSALKRDVENWRAGRAISTESAGTTRQVLRWLRPRALTVAGFVTLVAIAGAALFWSFTALEREQARSRAVGELVTEVLNAPAGESDKITAQSFEIASGAVADQPLLEQELARRSAERLLAEGRHGPAIDMLEPVLTRARGSFENTGGDVLELHLLLAEAYRQARRPDAALREFDRVVGLADAVGAPETPATTRLRLYRGRALALLELGRVDVARRALSDLSGDQSLPAAAREDLLAAISILDDPLPEACAATTSSRSEAPATDVARRACELGMLGASTR